MVKARNLTAAALALAALCAAPSGAGAGLRGADTAPRVLLPGDVAASAAPRADATGWIVGAVPRRAAARIARAHGAHHIAGGTWLSTRARARRLAAALRARGLLDYAEPDRISSRAQAPAPAPDPLSPASSWRDRVVEGQIPPAATRASPLIALVDSQLDTSHPELQGSSITTSGGQPLTDFHGTSTAAVAAAPANGIGNIGLWPGARALNLSLPAEIRCSDSARTIDAAVKAGAAVINMSYGSGSLCRAEADAIQRAVKAGIVPVAASGNEFDRGNPLEFPASLPHVVTVAALAQTDDAAFFSSSSAAVDLSAPGIGILTAVPVSPDSDFDPDGGADGFAAVNGTSFSAPMVSAAVAWVGAARPDLSPGQVAEVVRLGARDIGRPGYETATGYGILSVAGALARTAPPVDPAEPNDDIRFVDGRAFRRASAPLFTGPAVELAATADVAEDPVDVYRLRVPARRRVTLTLRPRVGDPDLYVFSGRAANIRSDGDLLGRSRRTGRRVDTVTVRNRGRRTATAYAAVGFTRGKDLDLLNASYALRIAGR